MSNQNQSNQYQEPDENGEDKKPSVYDEQHGIGENEGNHTSGGYIHYDDDNGPSSQNSTGGQDGEDVHTNNEGGTSSAGE